MSISRRHFLSTVSSVSILMAARCGAPAHAATLHLGGVLLGLTSPVYFSGFSPFLNWWKIAAAPSVKRSSGRDLWGQEVWETGGYLAVGTGEIVGPAPPDLESVSRVFFKSTNRFQVEAGCNYLGEEWIATWEGSAAGRIDFTTVGGLQEDVGSNELRFWTGRDPDQASLTLTLTDHKDPPRNVQIFQARYRRNIENGETFNPDWLAQIGQFGTIRFMGWMPTNNETISEFSQLADKNYFAWGQLFSSQTKNGEFGSKGGMHPELICELAKLTGCNVHVCIPVQASDDFVKSFAAYFRDNTGVEVTYELSNECWNIIFNQFQYCESQGAKIWPGDRAGVLKWYGYRAAACMKIVSDVYADASRWRGALATQTVDPAKTLQILEGVNYWRAHRLVPANSMPVSGLFQSLYVAGYFGYVASARAISGISNAAQGVVVCKGHGFKNGQSIKLYVTNGSIQLDDRFFTVANQTVDTFELLGISTVAMGMQLPACRLATSGALPSAPRYDNGADGAGATLAARPGHPLSVDDVAARQDDFILVKDQETRSENGIYRVSHVGDQFTGWLLTRAGFFDKASKMRAGSAVHIETGTKANRVFVLESNVEAVGRSFASFAEVQPRNYAVDATLFEMMEESIRRHRADPAEYPTKHTYFNAQMSRALIDGKCDTSLIVPCSVAALEQVYWPPQLAIARANQMTLRQYEGGCGLAGEGLLLGNPRLLVYDGNQQFGEFVFNFGHSQEAAAAYAENYLAFWRIGGENPAKFVAEGRSSNAGTWAGIRFWPLRANQNRGDAGNPVWMATLTASKQRGIQ